MSTLERSNSLRKKDNFKKSKAMETKSIIFKANWTTKKIPQIMHGEIVRYIYCDKFCDFYLVTCRDYDQTLDVINSSNPDFRLEFEYKIEPNIIKVLDFEIGDTNDNTYVRVATTRDGGFHLNSAKYNNNQK